MPRPIILGVVGDSAAGKTTITRGLVRLLGDEHVTHIAADDYHRFDRRQRAERAITPLHPDCNYLDIMEQDLAHVRARTGHPQARLPAQGRDVRARRLRRAAPVHGRRGAAGLPHADPARQLRRPRLPRPARGAAPPVEGAARLLAPRLHERPGPRGARPSRARLGGLHPPAAALGGHRRLLHAGRSRRPGPPRRPAHAARRPRPPRPERAHRRRRRGHAPARGRARAPPVDPGRHRRRPRPPRSRRRSGIACTSPATCAPSAWASSPSRPSCTARSRWRSCSCSSSITWSTARASVALGGAGSRVDREPAREGRASAAQRLSSTQTSAPAKAICPKVIAVPRLAAPSSAAIAVTTDEDARAGSQDRPRSRAAPPGLRGRRRGPARRRRGRRRPARARPRAGRRGRAGRARRARRRSRPARWRAAPPSRRAGRSRRARWASSAATSSSMPLTGAIEETATTSVSRSPSERSAACRSRRARRATSPRSALVTTSTSGISMIPALRNCRTSPEPGLDDDRDGVGHLGDVGLALADARRSRRRRRRRRRPARGRRRGWRAPARRGARRRRSSG